MNIKFFDFTYTNSLMRKELIESYKEFLDSNQYVLGNSTTIFEKSYADFSGVKYCSGISNGLDAIILSLKCLGITNGDEVIVPSNTYIATWLAVTSLGAKVIPVEPCIDSFNINPRLIESSITDKTKAIIPVHLYGQPCEIDDIMNIAKKHGLYVVEDNAQGHSALYKGKMTGTFGHINATSFYPGKNLGALGEAGCITTDSYEFKEKIDALRNYGSHRKYYNQYEGGNYRIDELQASQLIVRLKYLNHLTDQRMNIAKRYTKFIENNDVIKPQISKDAKHVFHQYVLRVEDRDRFLNYLNKKGIQTMIHYPIPPHRQDCYKHLGFQANHFPIANQLSETILSLPIYPGLKEEEQNYIIETINSF